MKNKSLLRFLFKIDFKTSKASYFLFSFLSFLNIIFLLAFYIMFNLNQPVNYENEQMIVNQMYRVATAETNLNHTIKRSNSVFLEENEISIYDYDIGKKITHIYDSADFLDEKMLRKGRLPENVNEVVITNNNVFSDPNTIEIKKESNYYDISGTFKVVGYLKYSFLNFSENNTNYLFFHNDILKRSVYIQNLKEALKYTNISNIGDHIAVDYSLEKNTFVLGQQFYDESQIKFNFNNKLYDIKIIENDSTGSYPSDKFLAFNPETFDNYNQIYSYEFDNMTNKNKFINRNDWLFNYSDLMEKHQLIDFNYNYMIIFSIVTSGLLVGMYLFVFLPNSVKNDNYLLKMTHAQKEMNLINLFQSVILFGFNLFTILFIYFVFPYFNPRWLTFFSLDYLFLIITLLISGLLCLSFYLLRRKNICR